jgi:Kdo2-lipid IVA lauroyltransferase/acyltransferase
MYYIVYGFLKLLSFIPLRLLYLLGDFIYFLIVYVFKYRKNVVMGNLQIAFPEKTEAERIRIMKDFYHNFCDTFMETIKLFSWSKKETLKRMKGNMEVVNEWKDKGKNVQLISGHFFNWELANFGMSPACTLPFVTVYMPLSNKVMNKIIFDLRTKAGTILVAATNFKKEVSEHMKGKYALVLVGDQNPGRPRNAYWLNFFSKAAPFVKGPEKGAKLNNTAVVYIDFYKVKRGYYEYHAELITDDPHQFKEGELTKILVKKIEDSIRKRPANYLWSHRRWKHEWKEEYKNLWVDSDPVR